MHRSRIGVVLIDLPADVYDSTSRFWAEAIGEERSPADAPPGEEPYESLGLLAGSLKLELQRTGTGTPPRVHLDIETDDVTAETSRLVALGASVVEKRKGYRIMADPGGLVFCVVPVQTEDFDEHAVTWPR